MAPARLPELLYDPRGTTVQAELPDVELYVPEGQIAKVNPDVE